MLLTKLKSFVAVALVLVAGAGVVGLTQGKGTGPAGPGQARAVEGARPLADDLEALRLEVEALRKTLQATRERVKTLEAEVQTLQRPGGAVPPSKGQSSEPGTSPGTIRRGAQDPNAGQPAGAVGQPAPNRHASPLHREAMENYSIWLKNLNQTRMADDPVVQAEAALKAIRAARDADARQRAADALEKALKRLKEQQQPNRAMPNKPGHE